MSVIVIGGGNKVNAAVKAMEVASMNWNDTQNAQGAALLDQAAATLNQFTNSQGIGPHAKS